MRAGVDIVRLPKTDTADDVIAMEKEIARIERDCGRKPGSTGMLAAIESAKVFCRLRLSLWRLHA